MNGQITNMERSTTSDRILSTDKEATFSRLAAGWYAIKQKSEYLKGSDVIETSAKQSFDRKYPNAKSPRELDSRYQADRSAFANYYWTTVNNFLTDEANAYRSEYAKVINFYSDDEKLRNLSQGLDWWIRIQNRIKFINETFSMPPSTGSGTRLPGAPTPADYRISAISQDSVISQIFVEAQIPEESDIFLRIESLKNRISQEHKIFFYFLAEENWSVLENDINNPEALRKRIAKTLTPILDAAVLLENQVEHWYKEDWSQFQPALELIASILFPADEDLRKIALEIASEKYKWTASDYVEVAAIALGTLLVVLAPHALPGVVMAWLAGIEAAATIAVPITRMIEDAELKVFDRVEIFGREQLVVNRDNMQDLLITLLVIGLIFILQGVVRKGYQAFLKKKFAKWEHPGFGKSHKGQEQVTEESRHRGSRSTSKVLVRKPTEEWRNYIIWRKGFKPSREYGEMAHEAVISLTKHMKGIKHPKLVDCLDFLGKRRSKIAYAQNDSDVAEFGVWRFGEAERRRTGIFGKYGFAKKDALNPDGTERIITGTLQGKEIPLTNIWPFEEGGYWFHMESKYLNVVLDHAEALFQRALKPSLGLGDTVTTVGELHWWLAHAMPFKRGSAAITDMLTKSIFRFRGISVTPWKRKVVPDVAALCESNPKRFSLEYADKFEPPGIRFELPDNTSAITTATSL